MLTNILLAQSRKVRFGEKILRDTIKGKVGFLKTSYCHVFKVRVGVRVSIGCRIVIVTFLYSL